MNACPPKGAGRMYAQTVNIRAQVAALRAATMMKADVEPHSAQPLNSSEI